MPDHAPESTTPSTTPASRPSNAGIDKPTRRTLAAVDRAMAELRRGAPVLVGDGAAAALVLAAETGDGEDLARLFALLAVPMAAGSKVFLALTAHRAVALGLVPASRITPGGAQRLRPAGRSGRRGRSAAPAGRSHGLPRRTRRPSPAAGKRRHRQSRRLCRSRHRAGQAGPPAAGRRHRPAARRGRRRARLRRRRGHPGRGRRRHREL